MLAIAGVAMRLPMRSMVKQIIFPLYFIIIVVYIRGLVFRYFVKKDDDFFLVRRLIFFVAGKIAKRLHVFFEILCHKYIFNISCSR